MEQHNWILLSFLQLEYTETELLLVMKVNTACLIFAMYKVNSSFYKHFNAIKWNKKHT